MGGGLPTKNVEYTLDIILIIIEKLTGVGRDNMYFTLTNRQIMITQKETPYTISYTCTYILSISTPDLLPWKFKMIDEI